MFVASAAAVPHSRKVQKGIKGRIAPTSGHAGEDAYLIGSTGSLQLLGVADGVAAWAEQVMDRCTPSRGGYDCRGSVRRAECRTTEGIRFESCAHARCGVALRALGRSRHCGWHCTIQGARAAIASLVKLGNVTRRCART